MDDLLVKLAELADPKLTVGSSDNGKILFEMSCQFEPVLPCVMITHNRPLDLIITQGL